ncbi:MAG: hypothetical protein DRJ35_01720 [Thermoprotei archaeon]|nr:MAG: hypothetical protein DRJ35_01720 [Thermoprotei archaeon]
MENSLSKDLGVLDGIGLGIGTIIGGTIYSALGLANKLTGGHPELAFFLSFMVALFVAKVYSDIVSRKPSSGGTYSVVNDGLGKVLGLPAAILQFFGYSVASAFYAWVFSDYFSAVFGGDPKVISLLVICFLTLILLLGAKESGRFTLVLSGFKVFVLLSIGFLAIYFLGIKINPRLPSLSNVVKAAFVIFFGFEGFEVIASASEEMRDPERDVPRSMFASLGLVLAVYMLLALSVNHLRSYNEKTILLSLADIVLNGPGVFFVLAGSLTSTTTAALSSMYVSSRLLYKLSVEERIPRVFSLTWRRGSPYVASLVTGVVAVLLAQSGTTMVLINWASLCFIALFFLVSLSGLRLLRNKIFPTLAIVSLLTLVFFGYVL